MRNAVAVPVSARAAARFAAEHGLGNGAIRLSAIVLFLACGGDPGPTDQAEGAAPLTQGEQQATLCFPGPDHLLRCAPGPVAASSSPEEAGAAIVAALLDGPPVTGATGWTAGGLLPPLPADVRLQAFDLVDGLAWVDLSVEQGGEAGRLTRPEMGLRQELAAVYSLVNSLAASPGIERVALMWNGEQRTTFAGHVDTTRPLLPDPGRNAPSTAPGP